MLRALSMRNNNKNSRGNDHLSGESSGDGAQRLKRLVSVPAGVYDVEFTKMVKELEAPLPATRTEAKNAKKSAKAHPLFGLFEGMWGKNKMTASPELSRYVQYLKEGGA